MEFTRELNVFGAFSWKESLMEFVHVLFFIFLWMLLYLNFPPPLRSLPLDSQLSWCWQTNCMNWIPLILWIQFWIILSCFRPSDHSMYIKREMQLKVSCIFFFWSFDFMMTVQLFCAIPTHLCDSWCSKINAFLSLEFCLRIFLQINVFNVLSHEWISPLCKIIIFVYGYS